MRRLSVGKKIAIYRESFNPPGRRHRLVAEALCSEFDEVIVAPWHRLPGKTIKYDVPPVYRATMIDLAFDPRHDPAEKLARIQFPAAGEMK